MMIDFVQFLAEQAADTEVAWSVGTFGAIAEFTRDVGEPAEIDRADGVVSAVTARGALRIEAPMTLRAIASESLTGQSWNQRVALCLPEQGCAMNRRGVLMEIGPDRRAVRAEDRDAMLFDIGLGALQVDAYVRSGEAATVAALRQCAGRPLFEPGNGAMAVILQANPHRIFESRVGRVEVFQPIPPPGGKSPDGPHTHVLPKLLRLQRTHAATEPLPPGWIPCAHFYPPHPARSALGQPRPFQAERHSAFQSLLSRYGDPLLADLKERVREAVTAGMAPSSVTIPADRFARAAVRVALRQLYVAETRSPMLLAWLSAYDQFDPNVPNDASGDHPCTA